MEFSPTNFEDDMYPSGLLLCWRTACSQKETQVFGGGLGAPRVTENLCPACVCKVLGTEQRALGLGNVVTTTDRESSYFACFTKSAFCWDRRLAWF